jgi:hypothetical protein
MGKGHGLGNLQTLFLILVASLVGWQCVFLVANERRLLQLHSQMTDSSNAVKFSSSQRIISQEAGSVGLTVSPEKSHRWDPGAEGRERPPTPLKVPTPVWVVSLPKSGTTSIWQYFQCGGRPAAHQWTKLPNGTSIQIGMCMRENIRNKRALLEDCGQYDLFSDTGFSLFVTKGVSDCFYPSMNALPYFQRAYPNGTLILITRNATNWEKSIQLHGNGSLVQRWRNCNLTKTYTPAAFYEWHTQHVREFALQFSNLTYIEVSLESPYAGQNLQEATGIPSACWGKCSSASKFCQRI